MDTNTAFNYFIDMLKLILNKCCQGVFPDCFKIAKFIPLHKKGNTNILDNFRPISLLP